MENKEVDLRPYFGAVWRKKIWILLFGLLVAGITVGAYFLMKPMYQADTDILVPSAMGSDESGNGGGGGGSSALGGLLGQPDMIQILKGVIESESVIRYVMQKSGIPRKKLMKMYTADQKKGASQLEINVIDNDPKVAKDVAQDFLDALYAVNAKTSEGMADRQAHMLDTALVEKNQQMKESENDLLKFIKGTRTAFDPSNPFSGAQYIYMLKQIEFELGNTEQELSAAQTQTAKVSQKALSLPTAIGAEWRQRLVELEYELRVSEISLGATNPTVVALQDQVNITKKQLQSEVDKYLSSVQGKVDPDLSKLEMERLVLMWQKQYLEGFAKVAPKEAVDLQRLMREAEIRATVLTNVRAEYEKAKLDTVIDRSLTWGILDPPYVEDEPTNKHFGRYFAAGLIGGMFLASLWTMGREGKRLRRTQEQLAAA